VTRIKAELRRQVIDRAGGCCEYCRIKQSERSIDFAIDHVIAEKHRGPTNADNLCLSCYRCNGYKGSDISSVDWDHTGELTWLYNPRRQQWSEHFYLNGGVIEPLTAAGRVTAALLRFNDTKRIQEREALIELGLYPCQKE